MGIIDKQGSSRHGTNTDITMSASSQATPAFGSQTYQIRVATAGQPAFFKIGDGTPTATSSDPQMPANWVDYFTCTPGQKCAVLQAGAAGVISIAEMS